MNLWTTFMSFTVIDLLRWPLITGSEVDCEPPTHLMVSLSHHDAYLISCKLVTTINPRICNNSSSNFGYFHFSLVQN